MQTAPPKLVDLVERLNVRPVSSMSVYQFFVKEKIFCLLCEALNCNTYILSFSHSYLLQMVFFTLEYVLRNTDTGIWGRANLFQLLSKSKNNIQLHISQSGSYMVQLTSILLPERGHSTHTTGLPDLNSGGGPRPTSLPLFYNDFFPLHNSNFIKWR